LTRPDGGKAIVAGHDVLTEADQVRRKIGYVAQQSGVDKHTTGRENLILQAQLQRVPKDEIDERVTRLLEWAGLAEAADQLVRTYSGGMKRRLDIAMGLVHHPEILFLDEPTTGLDPESRSLLWRYLDHLRREQQLTILLTTHYLEEADQMCDRLAIVDQGRVVVEGSPDELKSTIQGDTVTLEVNGSVSEATRLLQQINGVLDVKVVDSSIAVRVTSGSGEVVPLLITALEKNGVNIQSVSLSRPSLDDVYLFHTGRRFTSEDPASQTSLPEAGRRGGKG
jgi:ABC-2 type transport system ATP-binding protein